MKTGEFYFAYGHNMDPKQMRECLHKTPVAYKASLKGYSLRFNKRAKKVAKGQPGVGCANIVKSKADSVYGILYAVTSDDLEALDKCEGVNAKEYERVKIDVALEGGKTVSANVYIALKTDDSLKPTREYLDSLLAGGEYLPADYVKRLEGTDCN